jgi:hypothetical protein
MAHLEAADQMPDTALEALAHQVQAPRDQAHQAPDPQEAVDMVPQLESQPEAEDTDQLLPPKLPQLAALATLDHLDLPDLKAPLENQETTETQEKMEKTAKTPNSCPPKPPSHASSAQLAHKVHLEPQAQKDPLDQKDPLVSHQRTDNPENKANRVNQALKVVQAAKDHVEPQARTVVWYQFPDHKALLDLPDNKVKLDQRVNLVQMVNRSKDHLACPVMLEPLEEREDPAHPDLLDPAEKLARRDLASTAHLHVPLQAIKPFVHSPFLYISVVFVFFPIKNVPKPH